MDTADTESSNASSGNESENESNEEVNGLPDDYKTLSFEELIKLKDELGDKVYKEAVFGIDKKKKPSMKSLESKPKAKRLNKAEPREMSAKRQVPFLGADLRADRQKTSIRDPRFDEKSGSYHADTFKQNYKFISKIRQREVVQLKQQLHKETEQEEREKIKSTMQRLINKNVEQRKWQIKQTMVKKEKLEIQKAHNEGRQPHYATKKERRVKELVTQFEHLKKSGKLNKHLEKRRKKNTAKDRKKISLD